MAVLRGEQRGYVQRVASALAALRIDRFYDEGQKISLWRKDQVEEFQRTYLEDSATVVVFISSDYARRSWPMHERRAGLSRAIRERREYVLPVRFDDTVTPGLDPDISFLKAHDFTPEELAAAIAEKLVASLVSVSGTMQSDLGVPRWHTLEATEVRGCRMWCSD